MTALPKGALFMHGVPLDHRVSVVNEHPKAGQPALVVEKEHRPGLQLVVEAERGLQRRLPVFGCVLHNTVGIEEDVFDGHGKPGSGTRAVERRMFKRVFGERAETNLCGHEVLSLLEVGKRTQAAGVGALDGLNFKDDSAIAVRL